jgi:hypothetical protein
VIGDNFFSISKRPYLLNINMTKAVLVLI